MGRAQSDTYSSLFTKSDNVNLDETFDRKSALVHVLTYTWFTHDKIKSNSKLMLIFYYIITENNLVGILM